MFEHLQYKGAVVTVKTPAGKQADKILDFNDEASVKYREFVLDLITVLERNRRELIETITAIEQQTKQVAERRDELESEKNSAEQELKRTEEHLARVSGATWVGPAHISISTR